VVTVIEERLAELGIELPPAPQPVASYIPVKVVGDLAWVAAQIPMQDGAVTVTGYAGAGVTTEEANAGARRCAIQALAALRAALGTLDRVKGIVKVDVFVASASGFTEQPTVANGASDLLGGGLRRRGPACPRRGRRRGAAARARPSRWGCWFSSAERRTCSKRRWLRVRTGGRPNAS
jgi:enamine deaminase RidA (YjgF/YER057c/UK114 family)